MSNYHEFLVVKNLLHIKANTPNIGVQDLIANELNHYHKAACVQIMQNFQASASDRQLTEIGMLSLMGMSDAQATETVFTMALEHAQGANK